MKQNTRPADAYHTLYNLSGLSAAQHRVYMDSAKLAAARAEFKPRGEAEEGGTETADELDSRRGAVYAAAMSWAEDETATQIVGGPENRVVRLVLLLYPFH